MNITKFFNLSILEIEKYLEPYTYSDFKNIPMDGIHCSDLVRKLNLTSINNLYFLGRIRIKKKSNLYSVYAVRHTWSDEYDVFNIKFTIILNKYDRHYLTLILSTETLEVRYIRYDNDSFIDSSVNKTKKLKDYIDEYN